VFRFDLANDGPVQQDWLGDDIRDFVHGQDHITIAAGNIPHDFRAGYSAGANSGGFLSDSYVGLVFDASRNDLYYDYGSSGVMLAHVNIAISAADIIWA
jgi:hypothetical protein